MKRLNSHDKAVLRYCGGTIVAALLTVAIYLITTHQLVAEGTLLAVIILIFAIVQTIFQLLVFLHILDGDKPRWKLHSLLFVVGTILIIVVGSIWIMKNLDYNMGMTGEEMHEYMLKQNQKGF